MKTITFILLSFVLSAQLSAQEQTLISGQIESGGYGGPVVKFSKLNDKFALLVGGSGGWLINHSLLIGGGGYGLANSISAPKAAQAYYGGGDDLKIQFGYGGLLLEYIGGPNDLVHYSISTLIGAGGVHYGYWNDFSDSYYDDRSRASAFFVVEPSVGAEVNITRFLRSNVGASYRLIRGTDLPGISDSDLSDLSIYLTFKFGKF